jgi:HAD superfamily hydrolase (TIGR01509 family)
VIDAVIFDCDGVVVDSEAMSFDLIAAEMDAHGLHLPRAVLEMELLGGTLRDVWARSRQLGADLPEDWVESFYVRLYARLAQGTPLVPGILNVLNRLEAEGVPFAMGSNGSDAKMQITVGQHEGLLARFEGRMFSGQTLGCPKPAPDLYLHCARVLGVDPGRCVVIEDSPTGARAARAAGMRCFGYATKDGAALAAVGAVVFADMDDLPELLGI